MLWRKQSPRNRPQVFDIASRKVVRCYEDPTGGAIHTAAFHPDGTALASGCEDASIKVCLTEQELI